MFFNLFKKKNKIELQNTIEPIKCKCCNSMALYYGKVDLNKNCEEHKGILKLEKANIDVNYHLCQNCGFLFTSAFDEFKGEDWAKYIYNDDYVKVDPDYTGARSVYFSGLLKQMFTEEKPEILDFGGGKGMLAEILNKEGFNIETYDPFSDVNNIKPNKKYKMIFSFEVVEHSPTPIETFKEMTDLLDDNGIIVFSTLLCPDYKNEKSLLDWWYLAPRNGHISLHTGKSLANAISYKNDYVIAPFGQGLHIAFNPNNKPEFSKPWFN